MRICFIHPPTSFMTDRRVAPPLGILYIAAWLRQEEPDLDIVVLDQNLNDDTSQEMLVKQALMIDADIYGLSFGTTQYDDATCISRALRQHKPDSLVICGGPHATALPGETLEDTQCHLVVCAEGEQTMLDIVRAVREHRPLSEVPGCCLPDGSGGVVHTGKRALIKNIDSLPLPARDLVPMHLYTRTIENEPATSIITARGCPGRCIFCSQQMWEGRLRLRSVENIIAEIDEIYERHGIRNILFLDDTLTVHKKRMMELCKHLRERGVKWRGWTRANALDQELADCMAESGCMALCIGVESGSQEMLDAMKKNSSVEMNRKAIACIKKSGMYARASLMIGTPGESWSSVNATIDFVKDTQPDDWVMSVFVPVPGSEAYTYPDRFGMKLLPYPTREEFFRQFFVVGGAMESGAVMEYDRLPRLELKRMRDHMYTTLMRDCPPKLYTATGIK